MILEFADKRINEFKEAHLHFVNEGKGFEVVPKVGDYLLTKSLSIAGENVQIFQQSEQPLPTEKSLNSMTKAELVAEAERLGLTVVPDSQTKAEIIAVIEAKGE